MLRVVAFFLLTGCAMAAGSASDLARALREAPFDVNECYRIRDVKLVREDIQFYLTDGYLIFSKPVAGRPIAAVFSGQVEGGDAEVIVFPPDRAERQSLAAYTKSPNLDDHFRSALFLFTGQEYSVLKGQIDASPENKKLPEIGTILQENWSPLLHTIASSYQNRLVLDLFGQPKGGGLLAAFIESPKLGHFDVVYDPASSEQILAGQVTTRNNRTYFDTWMNFPDQRTRRNPAPKKYPIAVSDYRIDAAIDADLAMSAVTRVKVKANEPVPIVGFDIAQAMNVSEVNIDGKPAEVLVQQGMRANLVASGNAMFVVIPAQPLEPGREYEFEFHHKGKVIIDAGDHVFYVAARGNWYPAHGAQFARYDLTFRYPKEFDMVAPGDVIEDRTEGSQRITRRTTGVTIRNAGFNLGVYVHARLERAGYSVDVCANRQLEASLRPKPAPLVVDAVPVRPRRATDPLHATPTPEPALDPKARLQLLAGDVASALEFMGAKFGPPALPHLTVSPIPGTFGQGFPGLIYLSTLSYLQTLPNTVGQTSGTTGLFFEEMLQAHETAHQWWGNRTTAASYRDNWLMEALANYSALLYIEKHIGQKAADRMLDSYRDNLLAKGEDGATVDSAGPIVLGQRLENSQQPEGWRVITYGKGSWIIHMLRKRMGDQRFFAMLSEILKRYDHAPIDTEQFRKLAAEFLPPKSDDPQLESFFGQWVYGTGIPGLKLNYTVKGAAPAVKVTGTIAQTDVPADFEAMVPVEIQLGKGQSVTKWVATSSEPATFSIALKQAPLKVALDPHNSVLRR
jgi:hypothetical protein